MRRSEHALGDRVVAFSDYWHEEPYGIGTVEKVEHAPDHAVYYTVLLDKPVPMASPPRNEPRVFTARVLTIEDAKTHRQAVTERWGFVQYPDRWPELSTTKTEG